MYSLTQQFMKLKKVHLSPISKITLIFTSRLPASVRGRRRTIHELKL